MVPVSQQITDIQQALDENRYSIGSWQKLVSAVEALSPAERVAFSGSVSDLGNRVHQRHGYPEIPFPTGFLMELALLALGLYVFIRGAESLLLAIAASLALILSMQPFLKILTGFILGVRYAYAFLFYIEPRFKMQYGTYLSLTPMQRIIFHTSGVIGTPVAIVIAMQMLPDQAIVVFWGWILFWGAVAMQVIPFLAELAGLRRVGSYRLSSLTGAAAIATEIRKLSLG